VLSEKKRWDDSGALTRDERVESRRCWVGVGAAFAIFALLASGLLEAGVTTTSGEPVRTCGPDGYCNLEFCDIDDDLDCEPEGGFECDEDGICIDDCAFDPDCEVVQPGALDECLAEGTCFVLECEAMRSVAESVFARWPNAGTAIADTNLYGVGANWWWGHKKKSVDGFGAVLALVNTQPIIGEGGGPDPDGDGSWEPRIAPIPFTGNLDEPNLLAIDRTLDGWRDWPVIGFGYPINFDPCNKPMIDECVPDDAWFIHEAGYHHSLIGDGGMTLADDNHLCRFTPGWIQLGCLGAPRDVTTVDHGVGCEDIDMGDLETHINRIRHGRFWDLHVWFDPEGGPPVAAIDDPFKRWRNAPLGSRIELDPLTFFYQDEEECREGCE